MGPEYMLSGALLFALGAVFGRLMPGRKRGPRPVEAICGCGHHHSYHDSQTGHCAGTNRRNKWSDTGRDLGYHDVPCTCRQYSGPTPLPEFIAPEIADA